jgi:hypothetical protein
MFTFSIHGLPQKHADDGGQTVPVFSYIELTLNESGLRDGKDELPEGFCQYI